MKPVLPLMVALTCALATSACDPKTPKTPPPAQTNTTAAQTTAEAPSTTAQPKADTPKPNDGKQEKPLLWQIDGPNGPIYLMGTIHMAFDAERELPDYVWERFRASKTFVMETDLTKAQAETIKHMALPKGQTLESLLGPDHYKKLEERLGAVAVTSFRSAKPWFVITILLLKMLPEAGAITPMDGLFHAKAQAAGKKLGYLEPPEHQLAILEETMTAERLKETLDKFDEQKGELQTMIKAYRAGDEAELEKLTMKEIKTRKEVFDKLYFGRNRAWAPQIEQYAKEGHVFIAFGLAHMFGDDGVLKLMEKRGFKPYRVNAETAKKAP